MSVRTNAGFLDSVPIGAGMEWFTNTPPENWMLQNGAAISRTDYAELFAIIGTTYGAGNGSTTFNLPNKMGRVGVGKASSGTFATLGTKTGTETVTLTVSHIPPHVHDFDRYDYYKANIDPTTGDMAHGQEPNTALTRHTSYSAGGGQPHNNIQPSLVQNYIIKVK